MMRHAAAGALAAALLLAGAAGAQSGPGASGQLSVEEMERALGVGEAGEDDEAPRFRAPSFEVGDSGASPVAAGPAQEGPRSFEVPIEFAFGSTQITRDYLTTIDHVAQVLRRNPGLTLRIRGHTDAVGPADANAALSRRRAEAVRHAIISQGIAGRRLSAEGAGESMLIPGVDPMSGQNRRVEFLRVQ
jgi:outer membrane protein OmpA-like peptidoglycan-associated protein